MGNIPRPTGSVDRDRWRVRPVGVHWVSGRALAVIGYDDVHHRIIDPIDHTFTKKGSN